MNIIRHSASMIVTVLVCLSEAYAQSGWFSQSSSTNNDLFGVFFTDVNTGTAVGDSGTILRTSNGGTNWTMQTSGTLNLLQSVCFTDASTGTVVGKNGTILRTTNGGVSWTAQTSPFGSTKNLWQASFTDTNTGTGVGDDGIIIRTTNGGANWTSQTSGLTITVLDGVHFIDANNGAE